MAMGHRGYRPSAGVVVAVPATLALISFFFMPWLRLVEAGRGRAPQQQPTITWEDVARPVGQAPRRPAGQDAAAPEASPFRVDELGCSSGWELARGEMTAAPGRSLTGKDVPGARPWLYTCLVVPLLLFGLAGLAATGVRASAGMGWKMVLLAAVGVTFAFIVVLVNFADEAEDQIKGMSRSDTPTVSTPGRPIDLDRYLGRLTGSGGPIRKTRTTKYLWISVGLYVLVAMCGLASIHAPEKYRLKLSARLCYRSHPRLLRGRDPRALRRASSERSGQGPQFAQAAPPTPGEAAPQPSPRTPPKDEESAAQPAPPQKHDEPGRSKTPPRITVGWDKSKD